MMWAAELALFQEATLSCKVLVMVTPMSWTADNVAWARPPGQAAVLTSGCLGGLITSHLKLLLGWWESGLYKNNDIA